MAMRSDVRFDWLDRLRPRPPMANPGFSVDQLENAHPFEIGNRTLTGEDAVERGSVDNTARGEASA